MVNNVNENDFNNEISNGTVVADFWASWCGPCKMLGPVIEELSEEMGDSAKFIKVNVDDNPSVASSFRIASIPTVIVFKDGKVAQTLVGFRPKASLKGEIEKYI